MQKIGRRRSCLLFVFKVFARRRNQCLALCALIGLFLSSVSLTLKDSSWRYTDVLKKTKHFHITATKWRLDAGAQNSAAKPAVVTKEPQVQGEDVQALKPIVATTTSPHKQFVEVRNITRSAPTDVADMVQRLLDLRDTIRRGKFEIKINKSEKTDNATFFSLHDLAEVQLNRTLTVKEVCDRLRDQKNASNSEPRGGKSYYLGWWRKSNLYKTVEIYPPQHFLFCPALKVGSTFWKRLLYALQFGVSVSSPYEITIKKALGAKRQHLIDLTSGPKTKQGLGNTKGGVGAPLMGDSAVAQFYELSAKVMFTRQPFSKLLSGYVDKLFAPNPFFWNQLGRYIVRRFRQKPSTKSLQCGHDVTFPEFIQYVMEGERTGKGKRDDHFVPVFDQCKPCDVPYDVIGKMETFKQDVGLVMAELGFNLSRTTFDTWLQLSEEDAIADSITSPYSWRSKIVKCISWEEATGRIWRKLQIRGLIDKMEAFPADSYVHFKYSSARLIEGVRKAWDRFKASNASKSAQKMEAMSSAYSLVPKVHLDKLRDYFLLDFEFFGYPSRPDAVFAARRTWDVFDIQSSNGKR